MAADKTAATLTHLIAVCRDGEEVYGLAAEKVSKPQLPELLRATAGLHREIGEALRPHARDTAASTAPGGTFTDRFGQLEGGLDATSAAEAERALVPELEQAEQEVVQAFERALAEPMGAAARTLVLGKLEILRATHARFVEVARRAADA
jgi:uncharacterized protein (TIGR02284 family)